MVLSAVVALTAVLLAVSIGILVHELLHLVVLRAGGIACSMTVEWRPDSRAGFGTLVTGAWAVVEMEAASPACSPTTVRLAAIAPIAMVAPAAGYAALVTWGPLSGSLLGSMLLIGWLACSLPSPADFAALWHPETALDDVPVAA